MQTWFIVLGLTPSLISFAEDDVSLKQVQGVPQGVSEDILRVIEPRGYDISVQGKQFCTLWFVRQVETKADFRPTLNVKYPFEHGQLIGVIQVHRSGEFSDFRGQELPVGVYTLRYAQQPVDGNHVGTSELYDFLLALPATTDKNPSKITSFEQLVKLSAQVSMTTHPAILSLLPSQEGKLVNRLVKDSGRGWWVLQITLGNQPNSIALGLVIIGKSEG